MNNIITLDLRKLADDYEDLNNQAVTCPLCRGEGYVERPTGSDNTAQARNDLDLLSEIEMPCDECDGDGEYVPDDKTELPESDFAYWQELDELNTELNGELWSIARNSDDPVREDTFEDYARDYAESMGAIPDQNEWPIYCIDWKQAADDLAADYTSFYWDGHNWLIRY